MPASPPLALAVAGCAATPPAPSLAYGVSEPRCLGQPRTVLRLGPPRRRAAYPPPALPPAARPIRCTACSTSISLPDALALAPYAWDSLGAIWHECRACGTGHHLRFQADEVLLIRVTGSGPIWEAVRAEASPGTTCAHEADALAVTYQGATYRVPYRS